MLLNCGAGEDSWESLGLLGEQTNQSLRESTLKFIGRTVAEALILLLPGAKSWFIEKDPDAGQD